MDIVEAAQWRYATKKFDPERSINERDFDSIKDLLRWSPSSVNSQPWHFVIASTEDGRKCIAKGTQGPFSANEPKVLDASHVVLFCAKLDMDEAYLERITDVEAQDGRFPDPAGKDMANQVRAFYLNIHRTQLKDTPHWMEKQLYLNMGNVLLGASALGIDAVPIEGIDPNALNQEFGLIEQGYTAVALIAFGYRHPDDFNAKLPKSRLSETELFTEV
jgi:nitroreductase/dihydropteridine reductase